MWRKQTKGLGVGHNMRHVVPPAPSRTERNVRKAQIEHQEFAKHNDSTASLFDIRTTADEPRLKRQTRSLRRVGAHNLFLGQNQNRSWKVIQLDTFTRWVNWHLHKRGRRHLRVSNFLRDFRDGRVLMGLVDAFEGFQLGDPESLSALYKYDDPKSNVRHLLNHMKDNKYLSFPIKISQVTNGALNMTLSLVWMLVWRFEFDNNSKTFEQVLGWCTQTTQGHHSGAKTEDLGKSWWDGRAICALCDTLVPGCIDWSQIGPDPAFNTLYGVTAAWETMRVPRVLVPEDMAEQNVDELSMLTYLRGFQRVAVDLGRSLPPQPGGVLAASAASGNCDGPEAATWVPGCLEVSVHRGPKSRTVVEQDDDICRGLGFVPEEPGEVYEVHIKWRGEHVDGSPFLIGNDAFDEEALAGLLEAQQVDDDADGVLVPRVAETEWHETDVSDDGGNRLRKSRPTRWFDSADEEQREQRDERKELKSQGTRWFGAGGGLLAQSAPQSAFASTHPSTGYIGIAQSDEHSDSDEGTEVGYVNSNMDPGHAKPIQFESIAAPQWQCASQGGDVSDSGHGGSAEDMHDDSDAESSSDDSLDNFESCRMAAMAKKPFQSRSDNRFSQQGAEKETDFEPVWRGRKRRPTGNLIGQENAAPVFWATSE